MRADSDRFRGEARDVQETRRRPWSCVWRSLEDRSRSLPRWQRLVTATSPFQHTLHLVRYNCTRSRAEARAPPTGVPSPLNRDDAHISLSHSVLGVGGSLRSPFPRKEVIQPHLPVRLPCYDFVPVAAPALGRCLLAVGPRTSRLDNSHDVTGGVYKARVRIHRAMADTRLLATPPSWGRVAAPNLHWAVVWRLASACAVAAHCRRHCSVCVAPGVRAMRT